MESKIELPSKLMVLIALIQGFCLLYLHQAIELHYWPYQQPPWLIALYSLAMIWPTMLLLGLNTANKITIVKLTLPFALLAALLGYYIGHQATPVEHVRLHTVLFGFIFTVGIATFKTLIYTQQWAIKERITYSALFLWSWRNFLTLALSLLFTGCVYLILVLWGLLFKAIEIDYFHKLFEEPWFYYPALALANGFGTIIFRRLTGIIDTITRLQQALMKFLLIILVLVSILFLCALPFTGLSPLWASGGSGLILCMQALMLFYVNAAYQDHPDNWPYTKWLHRFVYLGVALLPIYSLISFYGLSLRVDQYGWSLSRYWAFLIWFLLALFPLGYLWGIAKYRDNWVHQLSRVNVCAGLVVLASMLIVNSPLLDFRKLTVTDQLQRLADNQITLEKFDIQYLHRHLARPGYEALQALKQEYADTHPNLALRIDALYAKPKELSSNREVFEAGITFLTPKPPEDFLNILYNKEMKEPWAIRNAQKLYLQEIDANQDGTQEYLWIKQRDDWSHLTLYYKVGETWKPLHLHTVWNRRDNREAFFQSLADGEITVIPSEWQDIEIGGIRFKVGLEE